MNLRSTLAGSLLSIATAIAAIPAAAQVPLNVGVNLSTSGSGAAQGIPQKNLIALLPAEVGGLAAQFHVLDNATDPTISIRNTRKLTESQVDVLIVGSTTPTALAAAEAAFESKTPMLSMAPLSLPPDRQAWVFVLPQPTDLMIEAVVEDIRARGARTVGYIGFSDPWGDLVYKSLTKFAQKYDLTVVNDERYSRTDTSVLPQVLKSTSLKPDAMLIGAAGTPAALPHMTLVERGYTGKIYHTHGAVNDDFLRIGGKRVEGAYAPIGPVVVATEMPANDPVRKVSEAFIDLYQKAYGVGPVNAFATWAYDGYLLLSRAAAAASARAKPGTAEFRQALRDALENDTGGVVGTNGVYNITAADHSGLDKRGRVIVTVRNGNWTLAR